jgi:hypothetical protein
VIVTEVLMKGLLDPEDAGFILPQDTSQHNIPEDLESLKIAYVTANST